MPRRSYPLELILRAHGPVELVNANEEILWASDSDDDFREEFNDEFLQEEDLEDILDFLEEFEFIDADERRHFQNETWDCTIESLGESETDDLTEDEDNEDNEDDDDD
jgi:hypothetical protein